VRDARRKSPHGSEPRRVNYLVAGPDELLIGEIEGLDVLRQPALIGNEPIRHAVDTLPQLLQLQAVERAYAVEEIALGDAPRVAGQALHRLNEALTQERPPEEEENHQIHHHQNDDEQHPLSLRSQDREHRQNAESGNQDRAGEEDPEGGEELPAQGGGFAQRSLIERGSSQRRRSP
jgi:hypothetical protein